MTMQRQNVELAVDEAKGVADAMRADALIDAGSGSATVWFIILCLVGLAVAIALLVLAGQQRRARRYADDEPSFDAYAVDDPFETADDGFASVEIEDRPAMPWHNAADEELDEPSENVVPIRVPPAEDPVRADTVADVTIDEAPTRYAFAAGVSPTTSASGLAGRSPPAAIAAAPEPQGARPMSRNFDDRPRDHSATAASGDDAPFVAPFIREDIERAERRQAERLDSLRDDVSRQFQAMKTENASRLDLFVSSVDRKLDTIGVGGSSFSEHDMQRVTEGSVRPIFERLERLSAQVATQEQRMGDLMKLIELRMGDLPSLSRDLHDTTASVADLRERLSETQERVGDIATDLRDQSGAVLGEMDGLREGLSRLERAILDRASEDGSVSVALTEVVRGTLNEGAYAFSKKLGNNETADCVITFGDRDERIAIDAGFPMDAFNQLPSRDAVRKNLPQAKAAEDQFRRAILRAILAAADKCIVPGETTDSCLLFLPSEAAYTTLHDRFGDLVRDAQRARVWLTSPSTLMGTLNLLSNLMPRRVDDAPKALVETKRADADREANAKRAADRDARERARAEADRREAERRAMRDEIASLRERATGLASELDRTRGTLTELIDTTERLTDSSEDADDDYRAPDWAEDDREDRYDEGDLR